MADAVPLCIDCKHCEKIYDPTLPKGETVMVSRPPPNCEHIDNWRCCKLESHRGWLLRSLDLRPRCIIDRMDAPRDGDWFCPDQKKRPRPRPPMTGSGVRPTAVAKESCSNRKPGGNDAHAETE